MHAIQLTSMTVGALKEIEGVTPREAERSKNMFALGLMAWLFRRPTEGTIAFLNAKFAKRPEILAANVKAFQTGYAFGETTEAFAVCYEVKPAPLEPGTYRNITGNQALSLGLIAASRQSGLPLFLGAYPITPASSILEELARYKSFGVRTFQAEDEIAAAGAALGASFGGSLGVTISSGPGHRAQGGDDRARDAARAAARRLRHPARRPVDRHADEAGAGRPAQRPLRPQRRVAGAGDRRRDAGRLLLRGDRGRAASRSSTARRCSSSRTRISPTAPSRGSCPDVDSLPDLSVEFATEPNDGEDFLPYLRDPETLSRPWAVPGTPGLEHRIGGLEKADGTGNISYDADNHDLMVRLRAQKVAGIAADIPELEVDHQEGADMLVLSWGGTYGPVAAGVRRVREAGGAVAHAHLRYLNPFPRNLGDVLRSYDRVLIPEMNLGQLLKLVRAEFLVDAHGYNKVRGMPFRAQELAEAIDR